MEDIQDFDTPQAMLDRITKFSEQGSAAYENMSDDIKAALVPGQHFVVFTDYSFLIFGEIIESEYDEDRHSLAASPHLRLTRAYSVACEDGEVGTHFACNLFPIPESMFDLAKQHRLDVSTEFIIELYTCCII